VFVLIDGARPDVFADLLDRGALPNIARHVVEPGGFATGTTVFPSTTGVGYLPFLYGRFPGHLGIPGIRWLERQRAAGGFAERWCAARSYCGPQQPWLDTDSIGGSTLFQAVPDSLAICTPITRGLRPRAHLIPVRRALLGSAAHYLGTYASLDRAVANAWLSCARRDWRFLFVVFPGVDGITHLKDPFHAAVIDGYRLADRALGAFLAERRAHGKPQPVLFVASDHGASEVRDHADIAIALEAWGVPTVRHPMHVWRRGARAAVMVSGNACAQVYIDPLSGRAHPLTHDEIPPDLLAKLTSLPAVRLAACRDGQGGVRVFAGAAEARIMADGETITYDTIAGDPLALGGSGSFADRELLERTMAGELPDAPRQLLQLFATPRAGDIALAARLYSDLRGPWELPEHRAGHGSLIPEHMLVPIAASIPLPDAPIRTVDLMPTFLEQLGVTPADDLDGVPFSALAGGVTP
jgi:hypothetical protein